MGLLPPCLFCEVDCPLRCTLPRALLPPCDLPRCSFLLGSFAFLESEPESVAVGGLDEAFLLILLLLVVDDGLGAFAFAVLAPTEAVREALRFLPPLFAPPPPDVGFLSSFLETGPVCEACCGLEGTASSVMS